MSAPGISEAPTRTEPPPPPPPPVPGQVPALRINTVSELGEVKRSPQEAYEPPAAIQNAMMTKDKKPFTYTPGMGGKLDLSQIRSPRMARRVAKNANDEGVEGPPKSALAQEPRSPTSNIYSHPQVAVAVFPQQPVNNLRSSLPRSPTVIERVETPPKPVVKVETKIVPVVNSTDIPSSPTTPTSPTQITLAKAPTPWMQKQAKQQEELPEWARRSSGKSQSSDCQLRPVQIEAVPPPPRIEDRPSIFSAINEPGHHQLMNTTPHHQSRWGNPVGMSCPPSQQPGATYIVPVQMSPQNQYQTTSPKFAPIDNQNNKNVSGTYVNQGHQVEPGPVQSKSFRVLQKITDTDPDKVDSEQLRKLQLTEDDRCLMNKFKEQVDGDTYLHQEEDPRYRGAAIPSRAFRYLQNITESGELSNANNTSRPVNSVIKNQNRNSKTFEEPPVYLPPSEQQAPEPKKYMGAAIPSRSFRILQAMTTPESIGPSMSVVTAITESTGDIVESESSSLKEISEGSCSLKSEEDTTYSQTDSSCDSDSYLVYSTGLQQLKKQLFHKQIETNVEANGDNSTDCEQQDIDDDEGDDDDDDDQEGLNNNDIDEEVQDDQQEEVQRDKNLVVEGEKKKSADALIMEQKIEKQPNADESVDEEKDAKEGTEEKEEDEEEEEKAETEDREKSFATVSVRLPLRLNKKKDKTAIETSVDFTLKRPKSRENPMFIVTSMENIHEEMKETEVGEKESESFTETKCLLSVPQENSSREEVTDDEDSGVTSDLSRIISEVDTDSECCLVRPRNQNKKYQRTQTHSRLFRLLSLEQLKVPMQEGNSSNSSGFTSPDCSLMQECVLERQLPTRPKSLDCEALFKRYREKQQDDSYYQTWKNGQQEQKQWKSAQGQSMYPRSNVLCPRVTSGRNLSQTRKSATVSSNLTPPFIRSNRRC